MDAEEKLRKEEVIWKKGKEIWDDWKITISIVWFLFLAIIGIGIFAVSFWLTGEWRGGNFSGEVDAAMINSLVTVLITVPITLITGAGTILVTVYFNLQTQKIAVQSQRSALRDRFLEERLKIYLNMERIIAKIELAIFGEDRLQMIDHISDLIVLVRGNEKYISQNIRRVFFTFDPKGLFNEKDEGFFTRNFNWCQRIKGLIKDELNFDVIDEDWGELQNSYLD
jgi:hypothetical protein